MLRACFFKERENVPREANFPFGKERGSRGLFLIFSPEFDPTLPAWMREIK
jgi:hypothetical protein